MGKIELIIVSGGYPIIEWNGAYLEMKADYLPQLRDEMRRIIQVTPGFQTVKGISAWGGKITQQSAERGAQSINQVISFKEIVLHEVEENTCDHHLIDAIRPSLGLLVWHQSKHFAQIGATRTFECLVCGRLHLATEKKTLMEDHALFPPVSCTGNRCYSHDIKKMLGSEHVTK